MCCGILIVTFVLLPLSSVNPQHFGFDYDSLSGNYGNPSAVSFVSGSSVVFSDGVFIQSQQTAPVVNRKDNRPPNQAKPKPRANGQPPVNNQTGNKGANVKRATDQYANNPFLKGNVPKQPTQRPPQTPKPKPKPPAQPTTAKPKPHPPKNTPPSPGQSNKPKPKPKQGQPTAKPPSPPGQAKKPPKKPANHPAPSGKPNANNANKKKGPTTPRNNNARNKGKGKGKGNGKKRVSQIKYEQYVASIFPDADSDGTEEVTDFHGRELAQPGEFPHMGAIGFRNPVLNKTEYKCGGSLISNIYVVTAAHCAELYGEPPKYVRFGDLNLKAAEENIDPQTRQVARIIKHPQYKDDILYHDIALFQLAKPIIFTEFVRPIRLWYDQELPATHAFAMGFGSVQFAGALTNRLTEFNLTIVPNDVCHMIMPKQENAPDGIINSQICATDYKQAGTDTFQGDSGGPLQVNFEGHRSGHVHGYLIGITSYGVLGASKYPGVYTRISSYVDWIEENVWASEYYNYN